MSPEKDQESILISRGELTLATRQEVIRVLGSYYGLETRILGENEELIIKNSPASEELFTGQRNEFKFRSIKNPSDFLVREHIEDFMPHRTENRSFRSGIGRVFNYLVDSKTLVTSRQRAQNGIKELEREPTPPEEITIQRRGELGLGEYSGNLINRWDYRSIVCARYAIQAGGIVDFAEALRRRDFYPKTTISIFEIANHLKMQFHNYNKQNTNIN